MNDAEVLVTGSHYVFETYHEAKVRLLRGIFPTYPEVEYKSFEISIVQRTKEIKQQSEACI